MTSPVRKAGVVAGLLAVSLVGFSASANAMPAADDEFRTAEADKRATLDPEKDVRGIPVRLQGRGQQKTSLIALSMPDGASLKTYCVELEVDIDRDHPNMDEVPWDSYPDPDSLFHQNRDRINWILHNSYPAVTRSDIENTVPHTFRGGLSEREAIAATQAAIWHFSDGAELARGNPTPGNAESSQDVRALYTYLTGAENEGLGDQPMPELALAPAALTGESGTVIGPFEVSTTAESAEFSSNLPESISLVDIAGAAVGGTVTDGTQIYAEVPEDADDGAGSVHLATSVTLSLGRLFVGSDYATYPTQSLILAASENTTLEVTGELSWTKPDKPEEPEPTETPEPTESPEPTQTPEPTETPEPTQTPEPTETPEPTGTPEPTESPEPTQTPEPTTPPEDDDELPDTGVSPGVLVSAGLAAVGAGLMMLARRRVRA